MGSRALTMAHVLAVVVLLDNCWTSACNFLSWSSKDLQNSQNGWTDTDGCRRVLN